MDFTRPDTEVLAAWCNARLGAQSAEHEGELTWFVGAEFLRHEANKALRQRSRMVDMKELWDVLRLVFPNVAACTLLRTKCFRGIRFYLDEKHEEFCTGV